MAAYSYLCPRCGSFDVGRPMGEANSQETCPECHREASRLFTAPTVRQVATTTLRALDMSAASGDSPRVVRSVPRRAAHSAHEQLDPRLTRLPRP